MFLCPSDKINFLKCSFSLDDRDGDRHRCGDREMPRTHGTDHVQLKSEKCRDKDRPWGGFTQTHRPRKRNEPREAEKAQGSKKGPEKQEGRGKLGREEGEKPVKWSELRSLA